MFAIGPPARLGGHSSDGNGRTARLLMNLLLIRGFYVPVAVRPEDRKLYPDALEYWYLAEDRGPFQTVMHERLDATLHEYLGALDESLPPSPGGEPV